MDLTLLVNQLLNGLQYGLVLFLLSFLFIFVIHQINAASELKGGRS